jgi:hypothetical protein
MRKVIRIQEMDYFFLLFSNSVRDLIRYLLERSSLFKILRNETGDELVLDDEAT